jgi:anti-sigma B factor antagonist
MDNIRISLSEGGHGRDVSEIRVDGVIDTLTASELEQVFDSLLRRGRYRLVVDLAGVDYISSAGWGIFISHIKDVRDNNGDVKLANMVPDVREIFELLEFDKVLEAHSSVESAVARFTGSSEQSSKKKVNGTGIQTVSEIALQAHPVRALSDQPLDMSATEPDPELFVLRMLKNDPFVTISEIRCEFEHQASGARVGWCRVFGILRRRGLLLQRSRFRYAWGRA